MNDKRRILRDTYLGLAMALILSSLIGIARAEVENNRFAVQMNPENGVLTVADKQSQTIWKQTASGVAVSDINENGDKITYVVDGKWNAGLELKENWIDLTLDGGAEAEIGRLEYPTGFVLNDRPEQNLVLPNCTGLVIPFSQRDEEYVQRVKGDYATMAGQNGLMMPWIGVADGDVAASMLALTPWDSDFHVGTGAQGYTYNVSWLSSKGTWAYPRQVRFYFASKGGYVALCKSYREYAKETGLLVTLDEKRARVPQVDQLLGAISMWIEDPPDVSLLKEMRDMGLENLLVSYHVPYEFFPPETRDKLGTYIRYESATKEFADQAHDLGYMVGRYDHLFALNAPGPKTPDYPPTREKYPDLRIPFYAPRSFGYPEHRTMGSPPVPGDDRARTGLDEGGGGPTMAAVGRRGGRAAAGVDDAPADPTVARRAGRGGDATAEGAPAMAARGGGGGGGRCAMKFAELARLYIPLDHERVGYDARLQDQVCAVNINECYDPAHPMTRKDCVKYRLEALDAQMEVGELSAAEHIAAWAVPSMCYAEAPTSFARLHRPTQNINTILLQPTPVDESFWATALNEAIRAPLWQLVFNDAVVVTNRWNVTPNMYDDPKAWDQEDLFCVLHNQMPTYTLDREHWEQQKDRIVKSFERVCHWTAQIGHEEMLNHQYVTPDRKVQRSDFTGGKSVIVNFGGEPYEVAAGMTVAPHDYLIMIQP